MNDHNDSTETTSEYDAFEAWLAETAEREDTDREAVINDLMSTYWILSELSTMMDEGEYSEMVERETDSGADHRAIIEVIESIAEMNARSAPEAQGAPGAIDPGLIQLIESIASKDSSAGAAGSDGAVQYRIEKLRDEVETLTRQLAQVERRAEKVEDSYGPRLGRLSDQFEELDEDLDEIKETVTWTADSQRVAELETRIEASEAALAGEIEELDDRFEYAYGSLKTILEHLLSSTERNEAKIGALVDVLESEVASLVAAREAAEALAALKREAHKEGIRHPRCDSCETVLDMALLADPSCPSCERAITGFETKTRFFRTKEIARTRPPRTDGDRISERASRLRERVERVEEPSAVERPEEFSRDEDA